ncbi:septation protein SepH [Williamsia phyllosphaerae]|uniref:DUF3071 domain-containing protein n=1 Tax=Williamsia phyllosphaerae TaxID=885042 RepID=A0ABQ1V3B3_9NOCA|nr:septation protein SepH [Williamsia phyllosphaerae]GGF36202.1 hypothetical protein GCM10007298_35030 [Williamsia phyllosphaerae]
MRELRVIGLEADGSSVVCQDPDSGEKFHIAADDRLRAAARGDLSRLGQIEIEMESSLRPREIQSRIRAGASVAQVAAAAGVTTDKVARFAHPVLLERSRAAELASSAHPVRVDGPALSTLSEVVAAALGARGHNPDDTTWDAWKGEDNRWVVQVSWRVGRSENHAHWRYLPGSSGGAVEPLDETADEITDPDMSRPLRGLTSVVTLAASSTAEFTVEADEVIGAQRARHEDPDPFDSAPRDIAPRETAPRETAPRETAQRDPAPRAPERFEPEPYEAADIDPAPAARVESRSTTAPLLDTEDDDDIDVPATSARDGSSTAGEPSEPPTPPRRRKAARKPSVPAWEDVLLGVRSNGNQ